MNSDFEELEDLINATQKMVKSGQMDTTKLLFLEKQAKNKSQKIIDELYEIIIDYLNYYNSEIPSSTRVVFANAKDNIKANIIAMENSIKSISLNSILLDNCMEILYIMYVVYRILEVKSNQSLDTNREPITNIINYGKFIRDKEKFYI